MSKNLLSLLLAVASFAVYYLVIGPVYKGTGGIWQPEASIQALKELNKQYDETLVRAEGLLGQAEQLQSQYSRISGDQKNIMKVMVPDSIDKVRLLSEASNILLQSGFSPRELSYSDGSSGGGRGSASLSFSVRTTYPQFKELMDTFEKSMRLFSIKNVSFSAPEKDGETVNYQVRLETYFIK